MKIYLIFFLIVLSNSICAQKYYLEDLVFLNQKSEYSLTGFLLKNKWKQHYIHSSTLPKLYFSKRTDEDPYSIEFIKHTILPLHNDSYIELVLLDSIRWEVLKIEAKEKFNSTLSELQLKEKKIDVYLSQKYAFLFYKKISEKNRLTKFFVSIYNLSTYQDLLRQQEFMDFWGEE